MSGQPVRRALVSVADKSGLVEFARRLVAGGVELVSSGGTARALAAAGLPVTAVSDVTGSPEILGGRVKTLHPVVHGGILADLADPAHVADLEQQGIAAFDLVVVNLYPFQETVARPGVTDREAIEQIDIGGPAMLRAAAKNHARVGAVSDPSQYREVAAAVESGGLDDELRARLATDAFFHTAAYDAAIVGWLERDQALPERLVLPLRRARALRYGENPHQAAAAYAGPGPSGWWEAAAVLQGKELSFNNLLDGEAAWRLATELGSGAAVIVKHTNPCGVAIRPTMAEAWDAAWECDPLSAFGGVAAVNGTLDAATAQRVVDVFVEVVVAPSVDESAQAILAGRPNLRVLEAPAPGSDDLDVRRIEGGALLQSRDVESAEGWEVVTSHQPTAGQQRELAFAWTVAGHTKSNAIVITRELAAVGVGAGDQSRVGAAERAVARAGKRADGGVAASDAFFPFRDGLDVLADAGVTAVIEPGGSRRDEEVIAAAEERGIALVFTGRRRFRH